MHSIQTTPIRAMPPVFRRGQGAVDSDVDLFGSVRERLEQRQFEAMGDAFRPHGGLACGAEVIHRLSRTGDDPWAALADWIMARSVLVVTWRGQTHVPMFQFDLTGMSLNPACARVAAELKPVFDDWELGLWFATPNTWLDGAMPVDLLASEELAVLQAARTDRYIARG
jgi:hypothetical protein